MPDGSDPGRVEKYTDRQVERVRRTVREPNRSDILETIRKATGQHCEPETEPAH